jgi:hypothetical protein
MRKLLFCGLLFGIFAAPADAAPAYRGGWCLVANLGIGAVSEKCSFRSFETCRAYAASYGPTSFCRASGYAIGDPPRRVKKKRKSQNY